MTAELIKLGIQDLEHARRSRWHRSRWENRYAGHGGGHAASEEEIQKTLAKLAMGHRARVQFNREAERRLLDD